MLPRCRISLSRSLQSVSWLESGQLYFRRFRSGSSQRSKSQQGSKSSPLQGHYGIKNAVKYNPLLASLTPQPRSKGFARAKTHQLDGFTVTDASDTIPLIQSQAKKWASLPHVLRRLEAFGIPRNHLPNLIACFLKDIREGMLSDEAKLEKLEFSRFILSPTERSSGQRLDQVLSQLFFTWASDPETQRILCARVPQSTLDIISRLYKVADLSYPADFFPKARSIKRKVIMHVGPTNSGKTHMALRALAAAPTGVYAGPLRLLAHEIWERLNKGQIVPLGMDPEGGTEPDTSFNLDIADERGLNPTVRKDGHDKYVRRCNLRTGEELRVVSADATLMSCTVEMATLEKHIDVAVVDEIQMIADPERGCMWTKAVLGLAARELHLCGEETAVPIIQDILKETGDEIIINRYERLAPLQIQKSSLQGDLSKIQEGDCLVTFSRGGIFALKRRVEQVTGLRCAVAYGRLPPELRSEQASLFNDPKSGYDVIVASDAIGMGLNLKIKRIVFETLKKFDGQKERQLSISQIKQIAGRAGRYGLHGTPGGLVTAVNEEDMPIIHEALAAPADPLSYAALDSPEYWMEEVAKVLPPVTSSKALFEVSSYVSKIRRPFQASVSNELEKMSGFIDTRAGDMLLSDKLLFKDCPTSWRDPMSLDVLSQIIRLYRTAIRVDLHAVLAAAPFMQELKRVEETMPHRGEPEMCMKALQILESMHKVLVLYIWLSFRHIVAFHGSDEAHELKVRVEKALEWCLQQISSQVSYSDLATSVCEVGRVGCSTLLIRGQ
ncbi:P-loop containing nucleoside triphosphate hydrolase protein [Melanogaster broomeanus]|nr:P-loop containing nucleoside triphosphate hydrolase protein [Melanogaster broomeanus]